MDEERHAGHLVDRHTRTRLAPLIAPAAALMCPPTEGHYMVYDKATKTFKCCKCGAR